MDLVWEKPVVVFYKERFDEPERKAFLVAKAWKLVISRAKEHDRLIGSIKDFFPLMGDIDYISSEEGISDHYVLCWFDDEEDDLSRAWRRLTGVTFPEGVSLRVTEKKKKTYNTDFEAKGGKLK